MEQLPGSIIVTIILQVGSSTSVMTTVTLPPPALPFCKMKLDDDPYDPTIGVILPIFTLTV